MSVVSISMGSFASSFLLPLGWTCHSGSAFAELGLTSPLPHCLSGSPVSAILVLLLVSAACGSPPPRRHPPPPLPRLPHSCGSPYSSGSPHSCGVACLPPSTALPPLGLSEVLVSPLLLVLRVLSRPCGCHCGCHCFFLISAFSLCISSSAYSIKGEKTILELDSCMSTRHKLKPSERREP